LGVTPPALNRDGSLLAVQTAKGQVLVFDASTGKELHRLGEEKPREKGMGLAPPGQLAFSADGKRLVVTGVEVGAKDRSVRFLGKSFDLAAGKELEAFEGPGKTAAVTVLSPDGSKLAWSTGPKGGELHVIDTVTGKDVCKLEDKDARNATNLIVFSADGGKLAVRQRDGGLVVWDTETSKRLAGFSSPERGRKDGGFVISVAGATMGTTLAFSADGQTLFGAAEDGNAVQRWDLAKERPEENNAGHLGQVNALAVAADGKAVITLGQDNTLRRWSPETGKEIDRFPIPAGTTALTFSPDGKRCAFVSGNGAALRDVASNGKPTRLEGEAALTELAFSADGKTVFGLSEPAALYVWEAETGKLLRRVRMTDTPPEAVGRKFFAVVAGTGSTPTPRILALSPDGQTAACLPVRQRGLVINFKGAPPPPPEDDRTIALWDTVRGKRIGKIEAPKGGATTLAFSPDGRLLALVGNDQSIVVWETASGQVRRRIQGEEADGNPAALAFSPDGRTLALGYPDRAIRFWDVDTGRLLGRLTGHQGRINSLAFSADGQTLFSASSDTTALAWSLKSINKPEAPAKAELQADAIDAAWDVLASTDAEKALQAIRTLAGFGHTAPILAERTKPAAPADPVLLTRLLADLEDKDFEKREKAEERLVQIGDLAITALEKVLAGNPGLESRKRIEHILDAIVTEEQPRPEVLRTLRAIEVLERLGSPAARQALEKLAGGEAAARQTKAARAALERLSASTSVRAD
jgi:WD40 repeat protein